MSVHADIDLIHDSDAHVSELHTATPRQLEAIDCLGWAHPGGKVRCTRGEWRTVLRLCAWQEGR